ncbi:hypothetical protein K440DRAFT_333170 [Wilcoxina mikolae CBS 423.85]|nr:hypothetical protein K440DRAFT_333170 [Wilcoxina mikolae CBS 423.85]
MVYLIAIRTVVSYIPDSEDKGSKELKSHTSIRISEAINWSGYHCVEIICHAIHIGLFVITLVRMGKI